MKASLFEGGTWSPWNLTLTLPSKQLAGLTKKPFQISEIPTLDYARRLVERLGINGEVSEDAPNVFQALYGDELRKRAQELRHREFVEWFSTLEWHPLGKKQTADVAAMYYYFLRVTGESAGAPQEFPPKVSVEAAQYQNGQLTLTLDDPNCSLLVAPVESGIKAFELMGLLRIWVPLLATYEFSLLQKVAYLYQDGLQEDEMAAHLDEPLVEVRKCLVRYRHLLKTSGQVDPRDSSEESTEVLPEGHPGDDQ